MKFNVFQINISISKLKTVLNVQLGVHHAQISPIPLLRHVEIALTDTFCIKGSATRTVCLISTLIQAISNALIVLLDVYHAHSTTRAIPSNVINVTKHIH